jgi:alkylation response protein AidB-like acyl-CoA dehydrogenase
LLSDSARAFIKEQLKAGKTTQAERWQAMNSLGWAGLLLPESVGGSELGIEDAGVLMDVMGEFCFETPLLMGAFLPSLLLGQLLDRDLARTLAQRIAGSGLLASIAWQERVGQIDGGAPDARLDGEGLSGAKLFVPGADLAELLIVSARSEIGQPLLAVIRPDAPGVVARMVEMNDGSRAALVTFTKVKIGDAEILAVSDRAQASLRIALDGGALLRAAQLGGLARATLAKTIAYLNVRIQFGQKLSEFQALQHRCVDLYMATRLANASWTAAARAFAFDPLSYKATIGVSAAKARCGDVANTVAKAAVQMHGAFGFTEEGGLGFALKTALAWSASCGKAEAHRRRFYSLSERGRNE